DTLFQLSAQGAESDGYRASVDQKIRSLNVGVSQPTALGVLGADFRSFEENTLSPDSIPLATFQRNPRAAPAGSTTAKRDGSSVNLWLESNIPEEAKIRGRVSYDESKSDVVTSFSSFALNKKRHSGDFSLSTRLRDSRVLAGLDFFDAAIGSTRSNLLKVAQQSSALYLNSETPVGESLVNLGVRQQSMKNTFTRTTASGSQASRENLVSWSTGGLSPIAASVLRYSIQSSFSFPNTDQLYTFHPTTFAPTDINPGIKPMKSDEAQVALSQSFDGIRTELAGRFLKIKDEIGFKSACSGAGSASCNTNLFDTTRLIVFASVGGRPSPSLSWSLSADSIQSTVDSGTNAGKRVPMVPKLVVKGSASLKRDGSVYRLLANHRGNMVQSDDFGNTGFRIPSRLTLDAGYTHTWPSTKLQLAFWVRNLTDKQYFDFASFGSVAPADGRAIELRIKQDF
ncbi:MAG: TonB-dependent receptor, partial [Betaproteobacteria bacterium]|nr:TonB-dependent receptor [Betaproteobacteria bacterium]